jgi:hypothetical protein
MAEILMKVTVRMKDQERAQVIDVKSREQWDSLLRRERDKKLKIISVCRLAKSKQ